MIQIVAGINEDVDIIDIEERVGVIGKSIFNEGEETGLRGVGSGEFRIVVLVSDVIARGDVDRESVCAFAVEETHQGLIEPAARQGLPSDFSMVAGDKTIAFGVAIRFDEDFLDGVALTNSRTDEAHHGGISLGNSIAGRGFHYYQLEDTVGIFDQSFARHTIVYRLSP